MSAAHRIGARAAFALAILIVLTTAILTRPAKTLTEFDQPLYFSVAYDLIHHRVFSNGWFGDAERTAAGPKPGMFFGPVYPFMIVALAKVDPRFAASVDCASDMYRDRRPYGSCETYVWPMLLVHALLLALAVLAIARAGELMTGAPAVFWSAAAVATAALVAEADQFAFVMTEAAAFALYSFAMLAMVLAWLERRRRYFLLAGLAFGVLCLTRFSFLIPALMMPVLCVLYARIAARRGSLAGALIFLLAFAAVLAPWAARNAISVGKFGLTEEYGSHALIERFAYDRMTAREFALAFPYCLPAVGAPLVARAFGAQAMARFDYESPGSFYDIGSTHRYQLFMLYGRIDPLIGRLIAQEMRDNWWRYLLVSIPLAWCGMWVGGWLALALVPMFAGGCIAAWRRRRPLLLFYAAPAVTMLALHAALANFSTRYNLALIGPFAVMVGFLILALGERGRRRAQARAPAP
jgi:4-amino-4-deoxy-L-arabinose transferase-like glycosyltransferase